MTLADKRTEQDTMIVRGDRLRYAAECAQNPVETPEADCDLNEATKIGFPEGAEMTGGFGYQAQEDRFPRQTARARCLEKAISRRAIVANQNVAESYDILTREKSFRVFHRKPVMEGAKTRDDVVENDCGEPFRVGPRTVRYLPDGAGGIEMRAGFKFATVTQNGLSGHASGFILPSTRGAPLP